MKDEGCDLRSMPTQAGTLNSQLTLTFLGTGTSQGVPMIGCDCEVCRSSDPRDQRLRSSIYIETPECAFVVDTGTDLRRFAYARGFMPVYASAETMRDLQRVFEFAFKATNPFPGYLKPEPHVIEGKFSLGKIDITPLPVPHGNALVNGYLFSRDGKKLVAYLSDCSEVPQKIVDLIAAVEVVIIDALRHKPHPTHLSVAQALDVAQRVGPGG